jgi:hypothetical protein
MTPTRSSTGISNASLPSCPPLIRDSIQFDEGVGKSVSGDQSVTQAFHLVEAGAVSLWVGTARLGTDGKEDHTVTVAVAREKGAKATHITVTVLAPLRDRK